MTSKTSSFLAQYYGDADPTTSSDFEAPKIVKKKKVANTPKLVTQGMKIVDFSDTNEDEHHNSVTLSSKESQFIDFSAASVRSRALENASSSPHSSHDLSPPRRSHEGDMNLPRRRANDYDTEDSELPRRVLGSSRKDDDLSPPRKRTLGHSEASSADLSPPRQLKQEKEDLSPPRRIIESPPRGERRSSFEMQDLSPPRRGLLDSPTLPRDLSPPRRGRPETPPMNIESRDLSPPRNRLNPPSRGLPASMLMSSGEKSGLQTGAEVTEQARIKREADLERLRAESSSMNRSELEMAHSTVFRDPSGRKLQSSESLHHHHHHEYHYHSHSKDEDHHPGKLDKFGDTAFKGRAVDDAELNSSWKKRERWSDPLAQLKTAGAISSDESDEDEVGGGGDFDDPMAKILRNKKRKRSEKSKKRKPSKYYTGWYPPNRFQLKPGAQWDGIDRSTGFEAKIFQSQLDAQHKREQEYRYGSSDM